ncbi:T9SS type A sorting domain-containing protein [Vicingaceae bacterium]|nr:T9SS type A sorting domain-containing protein [Vicingaceae bacterium]
MGGYQVLSNGNEISSNIVNRFDPRTNTYLSDGANIPVATDDHVQAVYNDSLIYVITGWSNTTNIPNVQIYDPTNDNWLVGTPVPNSNSYKAFGASGTIVGNTIYYHGGANTAFNFPYQPTMRIGTIDNSDPTQISWSPQATPFKTYRATCAIGDDGLTPFWIGGSEITYNYNGIAYNGSGGVPPRTTVLANEGEGILEESSPNIILPMDLRGIASISNSVKYIAGGMLAGQTVSNKAYLLEPYILTGIENNSHLNSFFIYPNPTSNQINIVFEKSENRKIQLLDILGNKVLNLKNNSNTLQLNVSTYPKGIYFVTVDSENGKSSQKIIIQ